MKKALLAMLTAGLVIYLSCLSPNEPRKTVTLQASISWLNGLQPLAGTPASVAKIRLHARTQDGNLFTAEIVPPDTNTSIQNVPDNFLGEVGAIGLDVNDSAIYAGTQPVVISPAAGTKLAIVCYLLPPRAPSMLALVNATYKTVSLAWLDKPQTELGYTLKRTWQGQEQTYTLAANSISFTDVTGIIPGAACKYTLSAFNEAGTSPSDSLSVSIPQFVQNFGAGPDTLVGAREYLVLTARANNLYNAVASYTWSFGGGTPSSQVSTSPQPYIVLTPSVVGDYSAILTAASIEGYSLSDTAIVHVGAGSLRAMVLLQDLVGSRMINVRIFDADNLLLDSFSTASGATLTRTPLYRSSVSLTATYPGFQAKSIALSVPSLTEVGIATPLVLQDTTPPVILNLDTAASVRFGTAVMFSTASIDSPYAVLPTSEWDFLGAGSFSAVTVPSQYTYPDTGTYSAVYRATDSHTNVALAHRAVTVLPLQARVTDTAQTSIVAALSKYNGADFISYQLFNHSTGAVLWQSLVKSDTLAAVTGLSRNTAYQLQAKWNYGISSKTATMHVATKRPVPPVLSVTAITSTSISLKWIKYSQSDFITYRVMQNTSGSYLLYGAESTVSTDTTVVISGLAYGTRYGLLLDTRVGNPSDTLHSNVVDTITIARTSPVLSTVSVTSTSVNLSWTRYKGDGLLAYHVMKYVGGTYQMQNAGLLVLADTAISVSGLAPGTQYQFRIDTKLTMPSDTLESNVVTATTALSRISPTLSTLSQTSASVTLNWTKYTGDGFAAYRVMKYVGGVYQFQNTEKTVLTDTTVAITGLTQGTQYQFRVDTRLTVPSDTLRSNIVTPTTLARVSPTISAVAQTTSSITLNWTKYGGDGFAGYRVMRYACVSVPSFGSSCSYSLVDSEITSIADTTKTVTGLSSGTAYQFRIDTRVTSPDQTLTSNTINPSTN